MIPQEAIDLAGELYDIDPLPSWAEFSTDPTKEKQANGWLAVGLKAYNLAQH